MTADAGRVLIVDDERLNRMLLRRALEAEGWTVAEATDGRSALDFLQSEATVWTRRRGRPGPPRSREWWTPAPR